jgi:hypothetical protein
MQLSARTMIGIVSFCLAMTGIFLGNMFQTMMIGEINRKRQDGNLISYVGYSFPKITRIFQEYRLLYPTGKLRIYALAAIALAIIGMIGAAIAFRIIG